MSTLSEEVHVTEGGEVPDPDFFSIFFNSHHRIHRMIRSDDTCDMTDQLDLMESLFRLTRYNLGHILCNVEQLCDLAQFAKLRTWVRALTKKHRYHSPEGPTYPMHQDCLVKDVIL